MLCAGTTMQVNNLNDYRTGGIQQHIKSCTSIIQEREPIKHFSERVRKNIKVLKITYRSCIPLSGFFFVTKFKKRKLKKELKKIRGEPLGSIEKLVILSTLWTVLATVRFFFSNNNWEVWCLNMMFLIYNKKRIYLDGLTEPNHTY